MVTPLQRDDRRKDVELRWAQLRIVLGWIQIAGGAASAVLLVQTGTSTSTLLVASVTGFLMVVSVLLFRVLKLPRSGGRLS